METVKEYIKIADDDLESAVALFNNKMYNTCVQHCAQAAEKYLKSFIFENGDLSHKKIMRSHDVGEIYLVCLELGLSSFDSDVVNVLDNLHGYYRTRYPAGADLEITEENAEEAIKIVNIVKDKINGVIS